MLKLEAKNNNEKIILKYLDENASDYLREKINTGSKTLSECWSFITNEARKKAVNRCACIDDSTVFGWAIHFFEEDSIKASKPQGKSTPEEHPDDNVTRVAPVTSHLKPKKKKEITVNDSQFSMEF